MKSLSPNDLGDYRLAEECRKIRIGDFIRSYRQKIKPLILNAELEAAGLKITLTTSKTAYRGTRYWFKCPLCNRRAGILYQDPMKQILGCRRCTRLKYRKQRFKGMIESDI